MWRVCVSPGLSLPLAFQRTELGDTLFWTTPSGSSFSGVLLVLNSQFLLIWKCVKAPILEIWCWVHNCGWTGSFYQHVKSVTWPPSDSLGYCWETAVILIDTALWVVCPLPLGPLTVLSCCPAASCHVRGDGWLLSVLSKVYRVFWFWSYLFILASSITWHYFLLKYFLLLYPHYIL